MTTLTINKNIIKNIFILEDNEERIEWFKTKLGNDFNLTFSKTAVDAIALLYHNKYDILFLDHDLEERWMTIDEENTGSYVAKAIKKLKLKVPIIIHSWNPAGVKNMINILSSYNNSCTCIPFLQFSIKIINK